MAGRPRDPNSIRETAKRLTVELGFPVSPRMVETWKSKGYDLADPVKLAARLRNQKIMPRGSRGKLPRPETPKIDETPPAKKTPAKPKEDPPEPPADKPPELDETEVERELAKLKVDLLAAIDRDQAAMIRIQIQGVRDVLKELREQGRYILKADALKDGARAALSVRAELEKLEDALPPLLEGRTSLQMKSKIRDYARSAMLELNRVFQ